MILGEHLPALQVVVPLFAAPLAVLVRVRGVAFLLALAASVCSLAIALALQSQVEASGSVSYAMGRWPPPWGIEYRVDRLNAFVLVLVSAIAVVACVYFRRSVDEEVARERQYLFYAMFLLCLVGLLGITITGDAFNLFVFLEISSLSTYVLIALGRDRRALTAAFQYLVMGTIGATFVVIGVGLLYLTTGSLNLADIAERLPGVRDTRPVMAALAFIAVGLSLKAALFPLHQWLPNAYAYAPSGIAAFFAATATKVSIYALLRFLYTVFGPALAFERLPLAEVALVLALGAMFIASAVAIYQADLKRMFAYSSVAQIGYIVLGISFASTTGLTAAIVHLANHAVTKGAIFLLLGGMAVAAGGTSFGRAAGLARAMPLTCFGMVVAGLSLIGVPGTAGFVTKWYLILAALEQGRWWLVFAIVGSSLLAVAYVWRFVEAAWLRSPPPESARVREAPAALLVPAAVLVVATVWFGLDTSLTLGPASRAAADLAGAGP